MDVPTSDGQTVEHLAIVDDIDVDAVIDLVAVVREPDNTTIHATWRRQAGRWVRAGEIAAALAEGPIKEARSFATDPRLAGLLAHVIAQVDAKTQTDRRVVSDDDTHDQWAEFERRLARYLVAMTSEGDHIVLDLHVNGYVPSSERSGHPYVQVAGFGRTGLRIEASGHVNVTEGNELPELAERRAARRGWLQALEVGNLVTEREQGDAADVAHEIIQLVRWGFAVGDVEQVNVHAWGPAAAPDAVRELTQLDEPLPTAPALSIVPPVQQAAPAYGYVVTLEHGVSRFKSTSREEVREWLATEDPAIANAVLSLVGDPDVTEAGRPIMEALLKQNYDATVTRFDLRTQADEWNQA